MGRRLVAVLALARIHAAITAAVLVLLGAHLSQVRDGATLTLLALVVALATAGGNALNDVHDHAIDRINRPDRPLPAGAIGVHAATILAWSALAGALAGATLLSCWCVAIAAANVLLLVAYGRWSKRLGTAKAGVVAYLVGSAVLFGALTPERIGLAVATLAACAALATAAREILKDVEDLPGDAAAGARTLPIAIGPGRARLVAGAATAAAVALGLVPWFAGIGGDGYAAGIAAGAVVLALGIADRDAGRAQRLVMAGSVIEMAAFYFGLG
ncbi:MAG: UbiA family prenyltransferase [Alphaproteobacteria bacterium]